MEIDIIYEDEEPKPYLDRMERTPEGDVLYHFWIGDVRLPGNWPRDGIPCWTYDSSLAREPGDGGLGLAFTIDKSLVNCKPCLELIHS